MPARELYGKALRLLKSDGRITCLEGGMYSVVGDHGTYLVKVTEESRVTCNCEGFQKKGMCSHAFAIILRRAERQV